MKFLYSALSLMLVSSVSAMPSNVLGRQIVRPPQNPACGSSCCSNISKDEVSDIPDELACEGCERGQTCCYTDKGDDPSTAENDGGGRYCASYV